MTHHPLPVALAYTITLGCVAMVALGALVRMVWPS